MAYEILLPCGRLVQGHPMELNPMKDNNGQVKIGNDGQPMSNSYIAVAVAKGGEQSWNQTEWGAQIHQAGVEGWSNGEHGSPQFAWKIVDGDSPVPDKNGNPWNQKEGFAGHWVIKISSMFNYPCYHAGKYQPHEVIQNKNEIKCGDYVRVQVSVKGNSPSQTAGVYINPMQLELSRAGVQIVSASVPDAAGAFGGQQATLPAGAQIDHAVGQAPPPVQQQQYAPPVQQAAPPPVQQTVAVLPVQQQQYAPPVQQAAIPPAPGLPPGQVAPDGAYLQPPQ